MNIKHLIAKKVTDYYIENEPSIEQIQHTQTVVAYTQLIATSEGLNGHELDLLEISAWLHDIGCPNARKLYGNSLPVNQQTEGKKLAKSWLDKTTELTEDEKSWIAEVVGTHHQFKHANELHFEPLFEADIIVNLIEGYYPKEKASHLFETMITTTSGKYLFERLFLKIKPE